MLVRNGQAMTAAEQRVEDEEDAKRENAGQVSARRERGCEEEEEEGGGRGVGEGVCVGGEGERE